MAHRCLKSQQLRYYPIIIHIPPCPHEQLQFYVLFIGVLTGEDLTGSFCRQKMGVQKPLTGLVQGTQPVCWFSHRF